MRLGKSRWIASAGLALSLLAATAGTASAIPLTFNGGTGSQNFHTTLSGSGALTVGANVNYQISVGGVLGFTTGGTISIPTQSVNVGVAGGSVTINTTPTGSAGLTLAGQQSALATDPGGDGLPPFGPGTGTVAGLPSVLTYADVTSLNTTLIPGSQPFTLNNLSVNGNTSLNILSLFDLNFATTINARPNGTLSNFKFVQDTPGNDLLPTPGTEVAPGTPNKTTNYLISGAPGTFSGNVTAGLDLSADLSLSVLGLFDIPFSFDFGNVTVVNNQAISAPFAIIGSTQLQDLNPGGYDGLPTGDDMKFTFNDGGYLNLIPLSFNINTSGSLPVNGSQNFSIDLGLGSVGGTITFNGSANYGFNGTIGASNTGYQLQTNVNNVVIPEPSSVCLAGLGLVAVLPLVRRRLRK